MAEESSEEYMSPFIKIIIGISIIFILTFALSIMAKGLFTSEEQQSISLTSSSIYTTPVTLTAGEGITSATAQIYNQTWLDFNLTEEDYVLVNLDITNSTAFWYKNSTSSDWTFVVNSSGTNYVNGIEGMPVQYPIYYNGTDYFIGFELISNLVSWYRMNDNVDLQTVIDSMGYSNGTAQQNTSVLHIDGKIGGALSFNGTGDYIELDNSFEPIMQNDFSVSLWAKADDGQFEDASYRTLLGLFGMTDSFYLLQQSDGSIKVIYDNSAIIGLAFSELFWSDGETEWTHFVIKIYQDGVNVKGELFVNGSLLCEGSTSGTMAEFTNSNKLLIGKNPYLIPEYFVGLIDNFMIFNKSLSQEEIEYLYHNGNNNIEDAVTLFNGSIDDVRLYNSSINETIINDIYARNNNYSQNLTGYYKLNSNSGTIAYDSSGNNNHGIIIGATWSNDGVLVTLVNGVDYTLDTVSGLFTLSADRVYDWVIVSWTYALNTDSQNIIKSFLEGLSLLSSNFSIWFTLSSLLVIVGIIGTIIYYITKFKGNGEFD